MRFRYLFFLLMWIYANNIVLEAKDAVKKLEEESEKISYELAEKVDEFLAGNEDSDKQEELIANIKKFTENTEIINEFLKNNNVE